MPVLQGKQEHAEKAPVEENVYSGSKADLSSSFEMPRLSFGVKPRLIPI